MEGRLADQVVINHERLSTSISHVFRAAELRLRASEGDERVSLITTVFGYSRGVRTNLYRDIMK